MKDTKNNRFGRIQNSCDPSTFHRRYKGISVLRFKICIIMGQCFSAAAQQVLEELQEDNKQNQQPAPSTDDKQLSYAQAAGAGSGNDETQPTSSYANAAAGGKNDARPPSSYAHAAGSDSQPYLSQQQQQNAVKPTTSSHSKQNKRLSAVYSSLPADAERVQVRNVYDGDTLTLKDERRARLLGIDCPEIKEQQPYAQEAKAYTKDLIEAHENDVYISFEENQEKEDHYGRLLVFLWVEKGPSQFLCINEGILEAGFASAYVPNSNSKLHNWDKMIALQNDARSNRRGKWQDFEDETVYKTSHGAAYHKRDCQHIADIRNLTELKASEAAAQGLHPCRTCCNPE
jgi:endonuclease YncB( thermonuclease family)